MGRLVAQVFFEARAGVGVDYAILALGEEEGAARR